MHAAGYVLFGLVRARSSRYVTVHPSCSAITAKERLIGWYHTGPRLRASDLEINEVIKRFVSSGPLIDNQRLVPGSDAPVTPRADT